MSARAGLALVLVALAAACSERSLAASPPRGAPPSVIELDDGGRYDPLAIARAATTVDNRDAAVPAACYVRTAGRSNPCASCHTAGRGRTRLDDSELQASYGFADTARTNYWRNLFVDRSRARAAISDAAIRDWIRTDNYTPLVRAMARVGSAYRGFRPDLDLWRGFDEAGFARDGSRWRAIRYQPFPGAGWPTNGSYGDAFIRLPRRFEQGAAGLTAPEIARLNYALVEAAITAGDGGSVDREVEPVDETLLGFDLDGDGAIRADTTRIRALPPAYAGAAAHDPVIAAALPQGTELLHTVRYLDPDQPNLAAARLKELRYARKVELLDDWGLTRAYDAVADEKSEGTAPVYQGSPEVGLLNGFGWQLQGFIEDAAGRLRLQTREEHAACMGCHGAIGVTVDHTFTIARKVPGRAGWQPQDLRGLIDRPELGQRVPEALAYARRVGAGDDLRANDEFLSRLFPAGRLATTEFARAAAGGDRDLAWLVSPSRTRALELDKAYRLLVREQSFARGRDALLAPATTVQAVVVDEDTGLAATDRIDRSPRLLLAW